MGDVLGAEVSLTITALASDPNLAAIEEPQQGLGVTRAFVSTSALRLTPCRASARDITLGGRGYDLLQAPTERVTTAVGELCSLRLDIDPVFESASEGIPEGASLHVEGRDAAGEPFALSSQSSMSLLFTAEEVTSFGEQPLLLGFDLSLWLAGLALPDTMADMSDTTGCAEADADAIAKSFDSQLLDAAALYVDSDGNGALDEDEQTPVARARR